MDPSDDAPAKVSARAAVTSSTVESPLVTRGVLGQPKRAATTPAGTDAGTTADPAAPTAPAGDRTKGVRGTARVAGAIRRQEQVFLIPGDPDRQPWQNRTVRFIGRAVVARRVQQPSTFLVIYLVLLLLVPSRLVLGPLGSIGTPANLFAFAALFWFGASWLLRRITTIPGTTPVYLAMFFLASAMTLSYIWAGRRNLTGIETNASYGGLLQLAAWIAIILITTSIMKYEELERVINVLVTLAAVVAVIGILEFFLRRSLTGWIEIPGLTSNLPPISTMTRGAYVRPTSTSAQPLELAGMLAVVLPFALYRAFHAPDLSALKRWLPVGLIAAGSMLTVSRSGIIGIILVMAVLVPTWNSRRMLPLVGVVIGSLGAVMVLIPGFLGTIWGLFSVILDGGDTSTQARTAGYAGLAEYIVERPWFGRGYGTFIPSQYRFTDNMYLLAMVEMGIVGVIAILALYLAMLHCGGAGRRLSVDPGRRELGRSFVAAAVAMFVITATFDTLSFAMLSGVFMLLLGLSGTYLALMRREAAQRAVDTSSAAPAVAPQPAP